METRIILASRSPRRKELLGKLLPDFEIIPARGEETASAGDPSALAEALAVQKAEEIFAAHPEACVIGADTVVWLDGRRYGKPRDEADAARILRELSGREHCVATGVCVRTPRGIFSGAEESFVRFFRLTEDFIAEYVGTGIPLDKAGAYGIQCEPSPVESWRGDFDGIVGLPTEKLRGLLRAAGIRTKEE